MPPVMITTVMPSAMMPIGAKLRVMLATFSTVPKLGSSQVMKTIRTKSAIVTQKAWLETTRWKSVCSLIADDVGDRRHDLRPRSRTLAMLHGSLPLSAR